MKTTSGAALTYEMASMLRAIDSTPSCEKATYAHLSYEAKKTVDMLIASGLVSVMNGNPVVTAAGKAAL